MILTKKTNENLSRRTRNETDEEVYRETLPGEKAEKTQDD